MTPDIGTSAPAGVYPGKPPLAWASPPVPVPRWASPPPGNANAGSARVAWVQPRGCKGRSPLHEKTWTPPSPPGKSALRARAGGIGAGKEAKGEVSRRQRRQAPRRATPTQVQPAPLGFSPLRAGFASCSGAPLGKPPPGNANAGLARAARIQLRGCKGRSPLHKITLDSPFPSGEGGWGDRGQEKKLKVRSAGDKEGKPHAGQRQRRFSPRRPGFSPGDARGEAPCMK